MALTCLEIIQEACLRIGILQPNAAVTSQDAQIKQLVAIANQEGIALAKRCDWQVLQAEATFTTLAAQLQGAVSTLAPGLKYIVNDTIWNRTQRVPVKGSKSPQEWQEMVAMNLTSPYSQYRVKGDSLYFYPIPSAGHTCAFEYLSKNWITLSAGGTGYRWANDLDVPLLDEDLLLAGIVWRWEKTKGLEYAEDFATYEKDVANAIARDGSKPVLNMGGGRDTFAPVAVVPAGSWNV